MCVISHADYAGRWDNLGQYLAGNPEQPQQLGIPAASSKIVEQRARRVGMVSDVGGPTGQSCDKPTLDRSRCKLCPSSPPSMFGSTEEPLELRSGEVGIGNETSALPEH